MNVSAEYRLKAIISILASLLAISWLSCTQVSSNMAQKKSQPLTTDKTEICDSRWYTTPEENPRCYELQETLTAAVKSGDITKVQDLIKDGANVNAGYYQSIPVLQQAASEGQTEIVSYLIDMGANINYVGDFGQTALTSAVYDGHKETAKVLLEKGADICACVRIDPSALGVAIKSGDQEMVDLLVNAGVKDCK